MKDPKSEPQKEITKEEMQIRVYTLEKRLDQMESLFINHVHDTGGNLAQRIVLKKK